MEAAVGMDLELRPDDIRGIFEWARAHLAKHVDGSFPRNRDEPRDGGAGDARWRQRALEAVNLKSFPRNPRKRAKWMEMLALPQIPAVPMDRLDGNAAYVARATANAILPQIILAFTEFAIEPTDRHRVRIDLQNAKVRQGMKTL